MNSQEFLLPNGLRFQTIHIDEPGSWALNKDGTTEDYYVIYHDNKLELFHVISRAPHKIEQIDLQTPLGAEHWQHVESCLVNRGAGRN